MEFPFPPEPPGYSIVLLARWILVAWALVGLGALVVRLRWWKSIQPREMGIWFVAGGISLVVAQFGNCRFHVWDNNDWLSPAEAAAFSVSIAGVAIGLCKLYGEGSYREMVPWLSIVFVIMGFAGVVGIICLPILSHPAEAGRRTQCKYNLKQIGLAMYNFHDVYHHFPAASSASVPVSWRVELLPYLEQFTKYDRGQPWDHSPNDRLALRELSAYKCPSNYLPQDADGRWFTAYSMPVGPHAVGANPLGTSIREFTDGTSNTIFVVEACGAQIVWTEPRDVDVVQRPTGFNLKGTRPRESAGWLSSYHAGGIYVAVADGSVRFISATTDPTLLKKLVSIDGGEPIGDGNW